MVYNTEITQPKKKMGDPTVSIPVGQSTTQKILQAPPPEWNLNALNPGKEIYRLPPPPSTPPVSTVETPAPHPALPPVTPRPMLVGLDPNAQTVNDLSVAKPLPPDAANALHYQSMGAPVGQREAGIFNKLAQLPPMSPEHANVMMQLAGSPPMDDMNQVALRQLAISKQLGPEQAKFFQMTGGLQAMDQQKADAFRQIATQQPMDPKMAQAYAMLMSQMGGR